MSGDQGKAGRYIEFTLGEREYAIPLLSVKEVISTPDEFTPLPNTPKHFMGIINLRGEIIPIIDFKVKLGLPTSEKREEVVLITDVADSHIGVLIDSINKVAEVTEDEIGPLGNVQIQVNADFIHGIFKKEESLTILLNLPKCLNIEDLDAIRDSKKAA